MRSKLFSIKTIIIIAINAFCIIAFFVCLILSSSIRDPLRSQQAARAWAGQSGERFAQLSAFFPESYGFNEENIFAVRKNLDQALLAASLEERPGRTLYTDAWSAEKNVTVPTERGPVEVKAIAVGGDFFVFHPLYLRDGSYLSPNDLMKDRVVLDEELAWRLFGASRVAGFEVMINDRTFKVAGVISREKDFASSKAYTDEFGLFMSFDALSAFAEEEDKEAEIRTYEIVMPDPISSFALNSLAEAISDERVHIVENSTRFSLGNSFSHVGAFGRHSIRSSGIVLPYWENAARIVEDWLALLLVLSLVFLVFPIICAIIYTVKLIRFGLKHGKRTVKDLVDEKDRREYEKFLLEHGDEPQIYDPRGFSDYNEYDGDDMINYDIYSDDDFHDADDMIDYDLIDDIKNDVNDIIDIYAGDNTTADKDNSTYIDILYDTSSYDIPSYDAPNYETPSYDAPSYGTNIDVNDELIDSIKNDVNDIMNFGTGSIANDDEAVSATEPDEDF